MCVCVCVCVYVCVMYESKLSCEYSMYITIIIIIIINCKWFFTRWQWLFYIIQNMKFVTNIFKSGGLHEKHVVATWNLGSNLSICL